MQSIGPPASLSHVPCSSSKPPVRQGIPWSIVHNHRPGETSQAQCVSTFELVVEQVDSGRRVTYSGTSDGTDLAALMAHEEGPSMAPDQGPGGSGYSSTPAGSAPPQAPAPAG